MALFDTFKESLSAFHLGDGPVLLAVSGGADSMALMHLFHSAGQPCGVAYFDHQTRQGASAEDGRFVALAAQGLNLPFYLGGADVAELAAAQGESFEMAARRARYAFLIETARTHGYTAIATGHHQDDQAETVLLRLLRGSSPGGLAGIAPRREAEGVAILRPMLDLRRAEVLAWLRAKNIGWREDASNEDTDVLRNRVRHELLPMLARDYNPSIADALARLSRLQRMDNRFLELQEFEARVACERGDDRVDRGAFGLIDSALQFRCMTHWIRRAGGEPDFESVSRAVDFIIHGHSGRQIDLGRGAALFLASDHAVFAPLAFGEMPGGVEDLIVSIPGEARGLGKSFQVRLIEKLPEVPLDQYCHAGLQMFDRAVLGDFLTIRRWRAGDRIRPLGMSGSRKLKAIYNDLGLSRPERARQIVVESGGRIIWVPGYGVGLEAAVGQQSRSYVELRIEDV